MGAQPFQRAGSLIRSIPKKRCLCLLPLVQTGPFVFGPLGLPVPRVSKHLEVPLACQDKGTCLRAHEPGSVRRGNSSGEASGRGPD